MADYKPARISVFECFCIFIVLTSLASLALLALGNFSTRLALPIGLFTTASTVLLGFKTWPKFSLKNTPVSVFIILMAILMRYPSAPYVSGGQDQGVYVNMAAQYERTGKNFIQDNVRRSAQEVGLGNYYDEYNQRNTSKAIPEKFEGQHLPGIYISNLEKSEYVFQFYPLPNNR